MLNKEKMLEWADVLDSGKYKQIRGLWGSKDGPMCCLNVAAVHFLGKDFFELGGRLPGRRQSAREAICEIFENDLSKVNRGWTVNFEIMNDEEKLSFSEIATKIREMVAAESD